MHCIFLVSRDSARTSEELACGKVMIVLQSRSSAEAMGALEVEIQVPFKMSELVLVPEQLFTVLI